MVKVERAKYDMEKLEEALAADRAFLAELQKNCKNEEEEHAKRVQIRTEEIRALAETLKILTADESRDLFGKTISFLQRGSSRESASASERAARQLAFSCWTSITVHLANRASSSPSSRQSGGSLLMARLGSKVALGYISC